MNSKLKRQKTLEARNKIAMQQLLAAAHVLRWGVEVLQADDEVVDGLVIGSKQFRALVREAVLGTEGTEGSGGDTDAKEERLLPDAEVGDGSTAGES